MVYSDWLMAAGGAVAQQRRCVAMPAWPGCVVAAVRRRTMRVGTRMHRPAPVSITPGLPGGVAAIAARGIAAVAAMCGRAVAATTAGRRRRQRFEG